MKAQTYMAMRIGTVDGKPCKRVQKNSDGTTTVQPVKKVGDGHIINDGEQFTTKNFKKGEV